MGTTSLEIEIKLPYPSVEAATQAIEALEATVDSPRCFEQNVLYDRPDGSLTDARQVLRVRRKGSGAWLTFKQGRDDDSPYLTRTEHETTVADPDAVERLLDGLGYRPIYRYEKYRTTFRTEGLSICLDETPIGCFVELEGAPEHIDATAKRLGFGQADYVLRSYRQLHREAADRGEIAADSMVFAAS